jgi:hypothetical protein
MDFGRKLVLATAGTALAIAALCFIGHSTVPGVRLATVVTARFSGLVFAFALVARASTLRHFAAHRADLALAFVAAHGVHFASVLSTAILDVESPFHNFKPSTFLTFAIGFSVIGVLAITARAASRPRKLTNAIATYVVWALFAVAFFSGRKHPASAAMVIVVVAALLLRIALGMRGARRRTASA